MKILIATDGSSFSSSAVGEACDYIIPGKTEVKVVSACDETPLATEAYGMTIEHRKVAIDAFRKQAEEAVKDAEKMIRERCGSEGLSLKSEVLTGRPASEIIDDAVEWGADLMIVGSHGRGFWDRALMGSVSTNVLHHAPCSVLVVREKKDNVRR